MTDETEASPGEAAFSRSTGLPPSFGKATEALKTRVPDKVKEDFVRLAHQMGTDESGLLREWILLGLYGKEGVKKLHTDRIEAVASTLPTEAPNGGWKTT